MPDLILTLVPLAVGSAIVPIQIIITILLLRSGTGRAAAAAWIAGMTATRLAQGVVFGFVLGPAEQGAGGSDETSLIVSIVLLVAAILLYVMAAKQFLRHPDEDDPPPKWMATFDGVSTAKAFVLGAGLLAVGFKFWVFTLGAIAAIGAAAVGQPSATIAFLLFIVMAESIHLALLGVALVAPTRADALLERFSTFLKERNRVIMITLGVVFGTWFLIKALDGLGVL